MPHAKPVVQWLYPGKYDAHALATCFRPDTIRLFMVMFTELVGMWHFRSYLLLIYCLSTEYYVLMYYAVPYCSTCTSSIT